MPTLLQYFRTETELNCYPEKYVQIIATWNALTLKNTNEAGIAAKFENCRVGHLKIH